MRKIELIKQRLESTLKDLCFDYDSDLMLDRNNSMLYFHIYTSNSKSLDFNIREVYDKIRVRTEYKDWTTEIEKKLLKILIETTGE